MKSAFKKVSKIFFYLTYVMILIALIIAVVFIYVQRREIDSINDQFIQARDELNSENDNKELTIADLKTEFSNLNQKIDELEAENAGLKSTIDEIKVTGIASISGKIFPVVSSSSKGGFNQYQTVCAQSVEDKNLKFCRTVSALDQNYVMNVPAGEYQVYAELANVAADSELFGVKAYYTQYVKCSREEGAAKCDRDKLTKNINISLKAGETAVDVDPIDWK